MVREMETLGIGIIKVTSKEKTQSILVMLLNVQFVVKEDTMWTHVFVFTNVKYVENMVILPALAIKIRTINRIKLHNLNLDHQSINSGHQSMDLLLNVKFAQRKATLLLIVSIELMFQRDIHLFLFLSVKSVVLKGMLH